MKEKLNFKNEFEKWMPEAEPPVLELKKVSKSEVEKIIKNMKNSLAFGMDELDAVTIKRAGKLLAGPISHIINLSLGNREFPAKYKLAKIIPLRKSTDNNPLEPSSFRPVSQLSVVSKLAEKWIQSQLLAHLERTALLHPHHHVYRRRLSTITAMIQMTDTIMEATDNNKITATMAVEQSEAFDCVPHGLLMDKLQYYYPGNQTLEWIESYLSHISSYVAIGNTVSRPEWLKTGVPQGSVMGLVLYLLFVNEFPNIVNKDDLRGDKEDKCGNEAHRNRTKLFGEPCQDCGTMTVFADDGVYITSSHSRDRNKDRIEEIFTRTKDYLNSVGIKSQLVLSHSWY